jgi:deazaflavin-dependent oxidoreductase (nitroreductase family)
MSISERFGDIGLRVHQFIYERADGWLGHRLILVPSLLLRTTGRRTGRTRTAALIYAPDRRDFVLVASNSGADRPPGWLLNVDANPDVEVQVGRQRIPARARVVRRGDTGYERLWELVNSNNHGRYRAYQAKTNRPIPIVVVTPKNAEAIEPARDG